MIKKNLGLRHLFVPVLAIALAGFLQNTALLNIGGIKPNLVLAVLVALSFFIHNFMEYLPLAILAAVFLRFSPVIELATALIVVIALVVHVFNDALPGRPFVNNAVIVIAATIVFYLAIDPDFLYGSFGAVALESAYNAAWGSLIFIGSQIFFKNEGARVKF